MTNTLGKCVMYEVIDNGAEVSIHNGFKPVWKASSCGKVECFRHILFTQKSIIIVLRQTTIIANKVEQTIKYVLAKKHIERLLPLQRSILLS